MDFVMERSMRPHKEQEGVTVEQVTVHKRNKTTMSPEDVRKIAAKLLDKAVAKNRNAKLLVTATNSLETNFVIKHMNKSIDMILDKDDYTNGQVNDDRKFKEYYLVNFIMQY